MAPAGAQTQPAAPAPASQPQTATPAPTARPPIQTKTNEEYQAYQTAAANSLNPPAMEKAADDFAAKFPTSDARVLLYRAAMSSYQDIGNSQKMMDMGMKVLTIDKDDPEALIGVAEVLEEHTTPTDLDRQQREEQVLDYAQHALKTIDTDLAVPAGTPPEKVETYKKYLRATALAIVGTIYYKQENFPEAETKLRESITTDPANPDPVIILRLALALDQQKKYGDALQQANRAVELTKEGTEIGGMARNERDRLLVQTANTAPASTPVSSPQVSVPSGNSTPNPGPASNSPNATAPSQPAAQPAQTAPGPNSPPNH
jgi:tetratricopeptide (TPR) repeat protein